MSASASIANGQLPSDPRLERVSQRFAAELHSDLDCVNELTRHVERFRGKMLRPTLIFATADAVLTAEQRGLADEALTMLATVVEMVHMATLVHDDVLDEAEVRRRGATINRLRGNEAAVMLGDYLISHAYHLCSTLDAELQHVARQPMSRVDRVPQPFGRLIAAATNTVCEGELLQLSHRHDWDLTEATYFDIIRRKTASLCGLSCRLPLLAAAATGGAPDDAADAYDPVQDALVQFGEQIGVAFQVVDDVLDLTGDPQVVGKTLGLDLAKGKLTLPLIRLLAVTDEAGRGELIGLLQAQVDPELPREARQRGVDQVRTRIEQADALGYARQWARKLVEQAVARLERDLPDNPGRTHLLEMADRLLARRY